MEFSIEQSRKLTHAIIGNALAKDYRVVPLWMIYRGEDKPYFSDSFLMCHSEEEAMKKLEKMRALLKENAVNDKNRQNAAAQEDIRLKKSEEAKNYGQDILARAEASAKGGTKSFPVRLTDGRVVQAPDAIQMHVANEEIEAIRNAREILQRGKELGPTLGFLTSGTANDQSIRAALLAALEKVQTKGVRNQGLLGEIKDKEIPNFGAWIPFAKDAKIADLEKLLKAREESVANSFTGDSFRPLPVTFNTK